MNIDQLKAFDKVSQMGSFTLAAKQLFLTQSAVSQQIKALESSLQVILFDRSAKTIKLTREGSFILPYVQKFLGLYNEIKLVSNQLNSLEKGTVSIGATTVIGTYFLPRIIGKFSKKYPGVEIHLRIGNTKAIHSLLKNGKVDFGFAGKLSGNIELDHSIIHTERFLMITSPKNPIFNQKNLCLIDFLNMPFIYREKGTQTRVVIENLFKEKTGKQFSEKCIELHNLEAAKKIVAEGYGVTIIPEVAVKEEISHGLLASLKTKDFDLDFDYYLFKGTFLTRASEAFLDTIYNSGIFNHGISAPLR